MATVLVADDSGALRERLVALCGEFGGLEVVGQARDCHEAMTSVDALRPEIVVLDIRMPGGSGIDVLKHIKRQRPAPEVIVLTNYPFPQYRSRCLAAGADFFFDKSTELDQVAGTLGSLARRGAATQGGPGATLAGDMGLVEQAAFLTSILESSTATGSNLAPELADSWSGPC